MIYTIFRSDGERYTDTFQAARSIDRTRQAIRNATTYKIRAGGFWWSREPVLTPAESLQRPVIGPMINIPRLSRERATDVPARSRPVYSSDGRTWDNAEYASLRAGKSRNCVGRAIAARVPFFGLFWSRKSVEDARLAEAEYKLKQTAVLA